MASPVRCLALALFPFLAGCNVLVGLSDLEKADCVTGCVDGGTGGSGSGGGAAALPTGAWIARRHTCATMTDLTLRCWGANGNGQLGDGTTEPHLRPAPVPGLVGVVYVALGLNHTCVTLEDGTAWCWGANARGQLGDGTTQDRTQPTLVNGLLTLASKVQAGEEHTCAELVDGSVYCWGSNVSGELGDGTTTDRPVPTKVTLPSTVKKMSLGGGRHSCATLDDGTAWCWGLNDSYQLGNSAMAMSTTPVQVAGLSGVQKVFVGRQHSCAIMGDSTVQCWGANDYGQLGDGTTTQRAAPAPVPGLSDVAALGSGYRHTCAGILSTATIKCWGANDHGQLGLGPGAASFIPDPTLVPDFIADNPSAGTKGEHTCAQGVDKNIYCWGWNDDGQIGDGTQTDRSVPTLVAF